MLVEHLARDPQRLGLLDQVVLTLHQIGAFGVFLEIGAKRAALSPSSTPVEHSALQGAWHQGYVAALDDLVNFRIRFAEQVQKDNPRGDFGAAKDLLNRGEITPEEYNAIINVPKEVL